MYICILVEQATPPVDPAVVAQLVEMGFNEPDVRNALIAANGSPDYAFELLSSGVPVSFFFAI